MSSFIEEIRRSGETSLDVLMKSKRIYRYEVNEAELEYLLDRYEEKLSLGESIGRFYIEYIKGSYESREFTDLLEVRTDVDVEQAMAS